MLFKNPRLVHEVDHNGRTPLHFSCMYKFQAITRLLIDFGANMLAMEKPYLDGFEDGQPEPHGYSPLEYAFRSGGAQVKMINEMIDQD